MGDRLTDRAWQSIVAGPLPPNRPEFVGDIVGGASAEMSPVVSTKREGSSLRIIDPAQPTPTWGRPKGSLLAISHEGLEQLASSWPEVRHLDLSRTRIADEDLGSLTAFRHLKAVNLGDTSITDQGLSYLAECRFLRGLVLSKTPVDDRSLSIVKNWVYLDELDLSDTSVTDRGINDLRQLRFLKKLDLRNTKVTPAGVNTLRQALPKCEILSGEQPGPASR
jgi:hypothetical protein